MAPSATTIELAPSLEANTLTLKSQVSGAQISNGPLKLSGALSDYKTYELAPLLGTKFENINLSEILKSAECDEKLRDLAIISTFFENI
jgi:hypothetical protein